MKTVKVSFTAIFSNPDVDEKDIEFLLQRMILRNNEIMIDVKEFEWEVEETSNDVIRNVVEAMIGEVHTKWINEKMPHFWDNYKYHPADSLARALMDDGIVGRIAIHLLGDICGFNVRQDEEEDALVSMIHQIHAMDPAEYQMVLNWFSSTTPLVRSNILKAIGEYRDNKGA